MTPIKIKINRIVPEGKGVAEWNDSKVYVLGAYPDEEVLVQPFRKKNDFVEARLLEVLNPNSNRLESNEIHHVSHSPWQTINYNYQIELKKQILLKCFKSLADTEISKFDFFESLKKSEYRTKMEFSFDEDILEDNSRQIFLAFHERGSHKRMLRLNFDKTKKDFYGCSLANNQINEYASKVLEWINITRLEEFDLKSLVIRYSEYENKVIGLLLFKNERDRVQEALLNTNNLKVNNLTIALSDYRSPMAKIDKVLYQNGDDFLIEKINNYKFKYYLDSFFQNNINQFEKTIKIIDEFIPNNSNILELYSGVGTLGMNYCNKANITGVEIIDSAIKSAKENIELNGLNNYNPILLPSEKIDPNLFDNIDILIVDPPRSGLHKKVINMINNNPPNRIIYLSCNPITQASDYNLLKDKYIIKYCAGFDYYPNTPHLESLLILDIK